MISKSEISLVRSLNQKKYRDANGLFVVEGEKLVNEAISSKQEIKHIFKIEDIGEENMKKISHLSTPSPILAVIKKPQRKDIEYKCSGLSLALDSIRDPGNLGTIIRIADWFGIDRIYASKDTVDVYNSKVSQASMGAIFRKEVIYTSLEDLVNFYLKNDAQVYGTFLDGENIYKKELSSEKSLIIMGNESRGISSELDSIINQRLLIPCFPIGSQSSESLNVAIACSIVCSEFRRL